MVSTGRCVDTIEDTGAFGIGDMFAEKRFYRGAGYHAWRH
jgi:hypothetical protein